MEHGKAILVVEAIRPNFSLREESNGRIVFFIMGYKAELLAPPQIEHAILLIRGQRVMLDRDLAAMYGVTTGNLNKAVRRNLSRFPGDFMFQLTADEASRFQFGILKEFAKLIDR